MNTRHNYRAEWADDRGIVVRDENGNTVKVQYARTSDNRTSYAYVDGVGFIGGWRYPHRAMKFRDLVDSINAGVCYSSMDALPNGRRRR